MRRRLLLLALALAGGIAVLVAYTAARAQFYDVAALARRAPRETALMRQRAREARRLGRPWRVRQVWVPYDRVSPLLRRAVLIAEDDAFYQHGGLDWNELRAATRQNLEEHRAARGGSTITQQLARNLFLGNRRTPTRKLTELFIALRMERTLSKRRILELYLNLIEWGDGLYGCEAAARRYWGVSSAQLDARQAVLLAAVIINPRRFSALDPPRRIERRVRLIAGRMHRRGYLGDADYAAAIGAPPPPPADSSAPAPGRPDSAGGVPGDPGPP